MRFVILVVLCVIEWHLAATLVNEYATREAAVNTPDCGKIVGVVSDHTESEGHVYQFYNIPYTEPPIGERRFKYPTLLTGGDCYKGTLDARIPRPIACPQESFFNLSVSEDCLFLNVISPDISPDTPLPVIFWIHGGGLVSGANFLHGYSFGPAESEILNAVIVNVNYRLGLLGFLQLEELWEQENSYGNYGIRDLITALQWVQNNIAAFGGDPGSVTIIGESAGATSVLALLSSPLANNLFHRGIALSPGPEMKSSYKDGARIHKEFIKETGCFTDTSDIISCLRSLPFKSLISKINYSGFGYMDFPMKYGKDKESVNMMFTDPKTVIQPPKQLKAAEYRPDKKIKVILSNTDYENTFLRVIGVPAAVHSFDEVYTNIIEYLKNLNIKDKEAQDFVEELKKVYAYVDDPQYLYELITSDIRQTCAINELALEMEQSKHHDIYRILITAGMESPPHFRAYHSWDTEALFGFEIAKSISGYVPGTRDVELRDNLRNLIKGFIRDEDIVDDWHVFPLSMLEFGTDKPMLKLSSIPLREKECQFLKKYGLDEYGAQN